LGATNGMLDVVMNTHGVAVERLYNRPIFSSLHAAFSGGCLIGAVCGGVFASQHIAPSLHFCLIAVMAGGIGLSACHWLLPTARTAHPDASMRRAFSVPRLSANMLILGIIAFCDLLGEGSAADWSAVYLQGTLHTSPGLAAGGFAAFSLTMTLGRLTGDYLAHRLGPAPFVRGSSLLAGVGLTLAIAIPNPYIVIAGYALFGAGVACIFPTILSATGRKAKGQESSAIATVSTLGYTGFLSGPPLIGLLAGWLTLRAALGAVILLMLISALLSKHIGSGWHDRAQVN
ncbi:MAG: MFS transporter, partial [Ktedonobacterales bacterium]